MALGPEAFAAADNSVALGALSDATRTNVVSVGSVDRGLTRQITNVAAGTEANDAVNKAQRSEAHTSELQSLMRISYAVCCLQIQKRMATTASKTHRRHKQHHIA